MQFASWNHTTSCCMLTVKGLHLFDFCALLAALSLYVVYMRILHNCEFVHANLKCILTVISTVDTIILFVRLADLADFSGHYDFEPSLQNSIKMIAFSMGMLSLYNLLAERAHTLYASQWYGHPQPARTHIFIIIYLLQFIFVLIAYRMVQNGGAEGARVYVAVLFGFAVVALAATLVYVIVARQKPMVKRRFRFIQHRISHHGGQTCSDFIAIFVPYQALSFLLTTALGGFLMFHIQLHDPRRFLLCQSLIYTTLAPRTIISMLIPLLRLPALHEPFMKLLGRQKRVPCPEEPQGTFNDGPKYIIVRAGKTQAISIDPDRHLHIDNCHANWGYTAEWSRASR